MSTQATSVITDPKRLRMVLIVISLALMMVVSAVSGLNVALPDLARDTQATQSELQWIVDAYTVTLAGLLFISGAIGARYGRRLILIVGLIIFGAAAAAAMFTSDPAVLIWLRALMGVGAAAVMPTTLSIITTSFPEERRGAAVGLWVGVAGGGAGLGLLMSGLLLE
ncbi:MAG: MFS transporter, partial [Actinobacteria bacterium]|nr:MFS transporter [Actinomycetota bacterium]